jgi:hypothetical protein
MKKHKKKRISERTYFQRVITYCLRCETMLHWDEAGRPGALNEGNQRMVECSHTGCWLVFVNLPAQACEYPRLDLLRLALVEAGVPDEAAETGALRLVLSTNLAAAA